MGQRPYLKYNVDLQLQTAWQEGNWAVTARLADKRAKALKDPYYEVVKACAQSKADDPSTSLAAAALVWQHVKDGTTIKDPEALALLEWATAQHFSDFKNDGDCYAETLGPLRVRAVKASPKDKDGALRCLASCMLHWDLVSAQQIAAILDRSFPQDRSLMFRNILITHMLSTSPQSPPDKKRLYGMLAQKQMERAAQVTEQAETAAKEAGEKVKPQARGIQTEQEALLLYDIIQTHGSPEDVQKVIDSPVFGPLPQFRQGRKEIFRQVVDRLFKQEKWQALYDLCKACLSMDDGFGLINTLGSDWTIWKKFVTAASHLSSSDPSVVEGVQGLLLQLIKQTNLRPIYKRNVMLARLAAAFDLAPKSTSDVLEGEPVSRRLKELVHFIKDQATRSSCFDDVLGFVERLDALGMRTLAYQIVPQLAETKQATADSARAELLTFKLQYLVSSCPLMYDGVAAPIPKMRCSVCSTESQWSSCAACLARLSDKALSLQQKVQDSTESSTSFKIDLITGTALLLAFSSIRLGFSALDYPRSRTSALTIRHLLRAIIILEQTLLQFPKHSRLCLVLSQLHLAVGSVQRAKDAWDPLSVKRTIVDSLGPLFFDRLSTISPISISTSTTPGAHFIEVMAGHFSTTLQNRMPSRLMEAFDGGNWTSVIGVSTYMNDLRRSSTRVMSTVEAIRADRMCGWPFGRLVDDPTFVQISDETNLTTVVDYGSLPTWDCSETVPLFARLRIGPTPTNTRMHLSLLAEAFIDVLAYKPVSMYKMNATSLETDRVFVIETIARLSHSMNKFSPHADETTCTSSERIFFDTITVLCALVLGTISGAATEILKELIEAAKTALETLRSTVTSLSPSEGHHGEVAEAMSQLHPVTMLQSSAVTARLATQFITEKSQSTLSKELVSMMQSLSSAIEASFKARKDHIKKIQTAVRAVGFQADLTKWLQDGGSDGDETDLKLGSLIDEKCVAELVASWKTNMKGWDEVKWDGN